MDVDVYQIVVDDDGVSVSVDMPVWNPMAWLVIAGKVAADVARVRGARNQRRAEETGALARLLWRAESDARFYARLKRMCAARRHLVLPGQHRASLRRLLAELG